jgi:hypothetical protein
LRFTGTAVGVIWIISAICSIFLEEKIGYQQNFEKNLNI